MRLRVQATERLGGLSDGNLAVVLGPELDARCWRARPQPLHCSRRSRRTLRGTAAVLRDGRELAVRLLGEGEEPLPVEDGKSARQGVDRAKAEQLSRPAWKPEASATGRCGRVGTGVVGCSDAAGCRGPTRLRLRHNPLFSVVVWSPRHHRRTRRGGVMASKGPRNVFISHIHEDDPGLSDLRSLLERNGMAVRNYSITSDKENNAKAEDYIKYDILAPRIRACSTMVVYLTPDTKQSSWVNWEIEYAQKEGKTIVGVWERGSRGCDLPEALEEYHGAVVGWNGDNIIDAINGRYQGMSDPSGRPRSTPLPIKRHPCA